MQHPPYYSAVFRIFLEMFGSAILCLATVQVVVAGYSVAFLWECFFFSVWMYMCARTHRRQRYLPKFSFIYSYCSVSEKLYFVPGLPLTAIITFPANFRRAPISAEFAKGFAQFQALISLACALEVHCICLFGHYLPHFFGTCSESVKLRRECATARASLLCERSLGMSFQRNIPSSSTMQQIPLLNIFTLPLALHEVSIQKKKPGLNHNTPLLNTSPYLNTKSGSRLH